VSLGRRQHSANEHRNLESILKLLISREFVNKSKVYTHIFEPVNYWREQLHCKPSCDPTKFFVSRGPAYSTPQRLKGSLITDEKNIKTELTRDALIHDLDVVSEAVTAVHPADIH